VNITDESRHIGVPDAVSTWNFPNKNHEHYRFIKLAWLIAVVAIYVHGSLQNNESCKT
jgi:hypothetical protein